jgi:hypothetical protein
MNFTPVTTGASGSLIGYVDGLTTEQILEKFGAFTDIWGETEKGYENHITFVAENGVRINLYDRWGMWRIGGLVEDTNLIHDFVNFLSTTFGTKVRFTNADDA